MLKYAYCQNQEFIMPSLLNKILTVTLAICLLCGFGFIIYKQYEISQRQAQIEHSVVSQKELADNIMRSLNNYATRKDIEKFAKDSNINLEAIREDLEKLKASLTSVTQTKVVSSKQSSTSVPSTTVKPATDSPGPSQVVCNGKELYCPDPYNYMKNTQELQITEQFGNEAVPSSKVGFSAWKKEPWSVEVPKREYNATTVIGTDDNNRQYAYSKFSITTEGKTYDLKINNSTTLQEPQSAKFSLFNPRLFLAVDGAVGVSSLPVRGEFTPSLQLGVASYGKTRAQPDWSFLQLGVGYGMVSQHVQGVLTPAAYNVGKHVPLMNNAYVGPSVQAGTDGNVYVGGGLRVGL